MFFNKQVGIETDLFQEFFCYIPDKRQKDVLLSQMTTKHITHKIINLIVKNYLKLQINQNYTLS